MESSSLEDSLSSREKIIISANILTAVSMMLESLLFIFLIFPTTVGFDSIPQQYDKKWNKNSFKYVRVKLK